MLWVEWVGQKSDSVVRLNWVNQKRYSVVLLVDFVGQKQVSSVCVYVCVCVCVCVCFVDGLGGSEW